MCFTADLEGQLIGAHAEPDRDGGLSPQQFLGATSPSAQHSLDLLRGPRMSLSSARLRQPLTEQIAEAQRTAQGLLVSGDGGEGQREARQRATGPLLQPRSGSSLCIFAFKPDCVEPTRSIQKPEESWPCVKLAIRDKARGAALFCTQYGGDVLTCVDDSQGQGMSRRSAVHVGRVVGFLAKQAFSLFSLPALEL